MGTCGLTSVLHSLTRGAVRPKGSASTRTMPTSVMRLRAAAVPVVSRSTKARAGANKCMGKRESGRLDDRTLVRYCTRMSNDRSYLASLQDYYARHRALPSYASIGQLL